MSADADLVQHPADTEWHRRQPVGERLDASAMTEGLPWAFDEVSMRPLDAFLIPEAPRGGEVDPATCRTCEPHPNVIWQDELWQVSAGWEAGGLPFVGAIAPREHWLLENAPHDVLAAYGPLMQRISQAVKSIPGVARCHFARWNDGSAHLHLWALARPAGMMQGRGAGLAFWDEILPAMPDEMMTGYIGIVAHALAAGGGEAFPNR